MASINERVATLEAIQRAHEEESSSMMESLSVRIDKAHSLAREAKDLAVQTNNSIENIPSKVVEQIRKDGRGFRMEFRDWLILLATIIMVAAAFWKH